MKKEKMIGKIINIKTGEDDNRRREYILNVLIVSMVLLLGTVSFLSTYTYLFSKRNVNFENCMSLKLVYLLTFIFIVLYAISRKGYYKISAFLYLVMHYSLTVFMIHKWGVEQMLTSVLMILLILMSGAFIGTSASFISSMIAGGTITMFFYLEKIKINIPNYSWKQSEWVGPEVIVLFTIFIIISIVSWLFNREINKSLKRARKSERSLRKERDNLEKIVAKRTKEVERLHTEKMAQLYRFAEFGRLSGGMFHDLINPLTVISLNMEQIKSNQVTGVEETRKYLERAIIASKKMEGFIMSVRRQMSKQEKRKNVYISNEIEQVIEMLSYKAKRDSVEIDYKSRVNPKVYCDPVKVSQIVTNLITNAIDSYSGKKGGNKKKRVVKVRMDKIKDEYRMSVQDFGVGISKKDREKIFEPFYSTKRSKGGMGIGLSLVEDVVKEYFNGKLELESKKGVGSTFTVVVSEEKDKK